uniref:Ion transport domain-containing protein n=1 Tax=Compsopogon caeruleus TaxID=31354 RepID=A0A7S1TCG5_9RHOD|mmetsp:Transcript_17570/g.36467  ORF Transcript_17570/g.36467 Transcript_17570/m.36467 type:complete len:311 (+) Transcript_17570:132-1064(+)
MSSEESVLIRRNVGSGDGEEGVLPSFAVWPDSGRGEGGSRSLRARVHNLVEGEIDTAFEYGILVLIALNVLLFMVGTVVVDGVGSPCESHCVTLNDRYEKAFESFEFFSVLVFTLEYVFRIWSALEFPKYGAMGPFFGRLAYASTFFCIVDLASIAPYWLNVLGIVPEVEYTTAFRMFRLVRLLKADKYINAFSLLDDVLSENAALLLATSYYAILALIISSTALYYTEHNNPDLAKYYESIPDALFPTILMLTGEFPLVDFTPWGQVISSIIAVIAVAIFAIPTGVLGAGFVKAVERAQNREFTVELDD